jgi:calcineurin-like phosphoesterase family protein
MSKIYFTADLHLGHKNIIVYSGRPYETAEEMDRALIKNWNSVVGPKDVVFIIGDFTYHSSTSWNSYEKLLLGHKVFLKGNHDKKQYAQIEYLGLNLNDKRYLLIHDSEDSFGKPDMVLCGHVHEKWLYKEYKDYYAVNVGVDQWKYRPITLAQIEQRMSDELEE